MKILKGVLAIFISMLLISTVTAMPMNNNKIIINKENSKLDNLIKDALSEYGDISEFKKLIYKWIDRKGFDTLIGGCEIIEQCNHYYNESDVRLAIEYGKDEVIDLFENENMNLWTAMYDINNTFDLDRIYKRINKLKPISVIDDIKGLLGIKTDYDSFNKSRDFFGQLFMQCIIDEMYEYPNAEEYIKHYTMNSRTYDSIDGMCNIIAKISLLWAIPLTLLFGLTGLIVSSLITYVFFAPITIPMTLYVSFVECLNNNVDDITESLIAIALQFGLVGLIVFGLPIIFKMVFMTPEGLYGIGYVFNKISVLSLIPSLTDYTLLTGEHRPEVMSFNQCFRVFVGLPTLFRCTVYDMDKVFWNDDKKYRDYTRIGIDWNNDFIYDEWSDFNEPEYHYDYSYFDVVHTFKTKGEHKVNIIAFDLQGMYSDVKTITVNVESRPRFREFENPLLKLILFLLTCGLSAYLYFINTIMHLPFLPR